MMGRVLLSLAFLAAAAPVSADMPAVCRVAEPQIERDFPLPQVMRAIAAKKLNILVIGAGSSSLPGPNGVKDAYPARLQVALRNALPGVAVTVATDVRSRRTAEQMVKSFAPALAASMPALVVWQTGTVDAMQSVDTDQFKAALDSGIGVARGAGADVVLINAQYSPRTESMIALGAYAEMMRWVALQKDVPVFDRFSIMKLWADLGTFDLYSTTKKLDIAAQVHDCIGHLLTKLILESAKPDESHGEGIRQD